jgi:hypothetical protein
MTDTATDADGAPAPARGMAADPADRIRPEVFRARLAELLVELLAPSDVERVVGGVRAWWARART